MTPPSINAREDRAATIRCPNCAATLPSVPSSIIDEQRVHRCDRCSLEFIHLPLEAARSRATDADAAHVSTGDRNRTESVSDETDALSAVLDELLDGFESPPGRSILEVGCGGGQRLARAAARGWKCFGIEASAAARSSAARHHPHALHVFESIDRLLPHEFDVVVMFDVIEHLRDPKQTLYQLFSKGAITQKTRVVITTLPMRPQCERGDSSRENCWHPSSRLLNYTERALDVFMRQLRFADVRIRTIFSTRSSVAPNDSSPDGRLLCDATGSDFAAFMHERYVPGTWSKIAEYEHLPRYRFAGAFANDRDTLDFGCGTGYGSAMLARLGARVTAIDIDASAIAWAEERHADAKVAFKRRDDSCRGIPDRSYDVITCFEMIEHVAEPTQRDVIAQFSRLLRPEGLAFISTPNPEVTALYGENPYHLREMTRDEFVELLSEHFEHVLLMTLSIQHAVLIAHESRALRRTAVDALADSDSAPTAAVFIAVCGHRALPDIEPRLLLDTDEDVIENMLEATRRENALSMRVYELDEKAFALGAEAMTLGHQLREARAEASANSTRCDQAKQLSRSLEAELEHAQANADALSSELDRLRSSRWLELEALFNARPWSSPQFKRLAYLTLSLCLPKGLKKVLHPLTKLYRNARAKQAGSTGRVNLPKPYEVKRAVGGEGRPCVLHVIANFMTGGSSRLVVDLIERLPDYEHRVLTSFQPSPPAYSNVALVECNLHQADRVRGLLDQHRPQLVHVHYWGDCDESWYRMVFDIVEQLKLPIVENVNTPVAPYLSTTIRHYVFVSDYVKREFGASARPASRIYPGSDFSLFRRGIDANSLGREIGMVYRLEHDKLNERSIDVFTEVARLKSDARMLIVGGGSLLESFKRSARQAGVFDRFEFTGYVAYEDLWSLYARMAVFVAPVWKESFGQVSPFAMSMGIPVVGYSVGAIPEIVGDDSLCAPAGDAAALAGIIVDLLEQPERRLSIGLVNQKRARDMFSVESMVDAYRGLYAELVGRREELLERQQ